MTEIQPKSKGGIWKQLIGIAIAALLLWLAFRGIDPDQFWTYLKAIKPQWVALLCVSGVFSHFLRAWRWLILLNPLTDRKVGLFNSFCAVMIGYAVNAVIPRGGEVARLVSICRSEELPWMGVLSTMFIDRLLDLALLMLLLGVTLTLVPTSAMANMSWLVPGGIGLSVATIAGLLLLPKMAEIINWIQAQPAVKKAVPAGILTSVARLSEQFDTGTKALKSPVSYPAIAFLSLCIWFFYWLNFYFMILAFGLEKLVSPVKCLIAFTIGSVGVLVPTPGNVGSFHFLVSQGLMLVASVPQNQALAYATVLHMFCFIVVTVVPAAICVAIQSGRTKAQAARTGSEAGSEDSKPTA